MNVIPTLLDFFSSLLGDFVVQRSSALLDYLFMPTLAYTSINVERTWEIKLMLAWTYYEGICWLLRSSACVVFFYVCYLRPLAYVAYFGIYVSTWAYVVHTV